MAWFGVGSGSRRAKPGRVQGFEQADRVVVEAFADLHEARHFDSTATKLGRRAGRAFAELKKRAKEPRE